MKIWLFLIILLFSVSFAEKDPEWPKKDLRALPDPKPWAISMDLEKVQPLSMQVCSYDIFGNRLDTLDDFMKGLTFNMAQSYWKNTIHAQSYHPAMDSMVYAVHDSIRSCLKDLKKKDKKSWCIQSCLYTDCSWGEGYYPKRKECIWRKDRRRRIACDHTMYLTDCMEDESEGFFYDN